MNFKICHPSQYNYTDFGQTVKLNTHFTGIQFQTENVLFSPFVPSQVEHSIMDSITWNEYVQTIVNTQVVNLPVILTGSRRLGTFSPNSDWDYAMDYELQSEVSLKDWYALIENLSYLDSQTVKVYRHKKYPIDLRMVKDISLVDSANSFLAINPQIAQHIHRLKNRGSKNMVTNFWNDLYHSLK